jgi:micrococcal nuclease
MFQYRCSIVRVIDGDTVVLDIDLGFHTTVRESCRLRGIDAPEVRGEERPQGLESKAFLEWLISASDKSDDKFVCHTVRDRQGKYGRYLVDLWMETSVGDEICVNTVMVEEGYAEEYDK